MITFKQYLAEARMAPLYHATYAQAATKILSNNAIKVGFERPGYHKPMVSLTRNYTFAYNYAPIVFELDQQKLAQNYKIKPYNFFGTGGGSARLKPDQTTIRNQDYNFLNQFEEAIEKDITNLDRYLVRVIANVSLDYLEKEYPLIYDHPKLYKMDINTKKITKVHK